MDSANRAYRELLIQILKVVVLFTLVSIVSLLLATRLAAPALQKAILRPDPGIKRVIDPSGQSRVLYSGDKVPAELEEQLSFPAAQLILQNQRRFFEAQGSEERAAALDQGAPPDQRRQMLLASTAFIRGYDQFNPGESLSDWEARWERFSSLDSSLRARLSSRSDDLTSAAPRPGHSALGLRVDSVSDDPLHMTVLDARPDSAYLNLTGLVSYTGSNAIYRGRRVRRSYNLVLERGDRGWKVSRVAIQTLGEVI